MEEKTIDGYNGFMLACERGKFDISIFLLEVGVNTKTDEKHKWLKNRLRRNTEFKTLLKSKIQDLKSIVQILDEIFIHEDNMLSKLIFNFAFGLKNLENSFEEFFIENNTQSNSMFLECTVTL